MRMKFNVSMRRCAVTLGVPSRVSAPGGSAHGAAQALLGMAVFLAVIFTAVFASAQTPRRIVSLKPNITEILFALGAGDRVVGATRYCDYPPAAARLPRVADYVRPFTERIIALAPDLVIGSEENSSKKSIETIRRMGYEVRLFSFETIDATLASIRRIGALIGAPARGEELAAAIAGVLDAARAGRPARAGPRVLVVWDHRPLIVAGRKSFMHELLTRLGAQNAVGAGTVRYPHWSVENIIARNPDVIVDMAMAPGGGRDDFWRRLTTVNAVRNGRVYRLDADIFSRAGPRLVEAISELSAVLYETDDVQARPYMDR